MNFGLGFLCFIFLIITENLANAEKKSNMGSYDIIYRKYEACKGPKLKNATDFSTNMTIVGDQRYGYFNFFFYSNTRIDEIKIAVHLLNENTKKLLWNYKLTDPCQHYHAAALLKVYFNTKNCVVPKGHYLIKVNFEDHARSFLGPKFFYGVYLLKTNMFSKQGNIMCLILEQEFAKKKV